MSSKSRTNDQHHSSTSTQQQSNHVFLCIFSFLLPPPAASVLVQLDQPSCLCDSFILCFLFSLSLDLDLILFCKSVSRGERVMCSSILLCPCLSRSFSLYHPFVFSILLFLFVSMWYVCVCCMGTLELRSDRFVPLSRLLSVVRSSSGCGSDGVIVGYVAQRGEGEEEGRECMDKNTH